MWEHFFETTETIADGNGFSLYGTVHITWLCAFAAVTAAVCILYSKCGERGRGVILWTMTALTLSNELAKYIVLGASGHFTLEYLPLHVCSINIFVILAYSVTTKPVLAEVLYAVSLPGALAALLFPSWTALPPTSFMHIHSFTVHTELFIFPVLLLIGGFRPSFRRLAGALPVMVTVVVSVFVFNKVFDTEYMFLNGAGQGNPLSFFESLLGDPAYLISLPPMVAAVWCVMYGLPALFRRGGKRDKNSERHTA